jgi:hypothetical protein
VSIIDAGTNEIIWLGVLLGIGFKIGKILVDLLYLLIALIFAGVIGLASLIANWWLNRSCRNDIIPVRMERN